MVSCKLYITIFFSIWHYHCHIHESQNGFTKLDRIGKPIAFGAPSTFNLNIQNILFKPWINIFKNVDLLHWRVLLSTPTPRNALSCKCLLKHRPVGLFMDVALNCLVALENFMHLFLVQFHTAKSHRSWTHSFRHSKLYRADQRREMARNHSMYLLPLCCLCFSLDVSFLLKVGVIVCDSVYCGALERIH